MQFTCDNGEVTAMTSSNGTSYSIGPEITIADLTSNGGSNSSYWVDRSTGLSTEKFPIIINPPGGGVISNRVYSGAVGAYWAFTGNGTGTVGYFNGLPIRIESFVSDGAAFTLPGMGIYISPTLWNSLSHDEKIQLLAHEYGHQYTFNTLERMYGTVQAINQYIGISVYSVTSALDWTGDGNHMHTITEVWANYYGWLVMGCPPVWQGGGTVPHGYWDPAYYFPGMPGLPE